MSFWLLLTHRSTYSLSHLLLDDRRLTLRRHGRHLLLHSHRRGDGIHAGEALSRERYEFLANLGDLDLLLDLLLEEAMDLFPHLYAPLSLDVVIWKKPMPMRADGLHDLPEGIA